MGFSFNNKLVIEIDGVKTNINVSNPKIIESFENLLQVTKEISSCNNEAKLMENNEKLSKVCEGLICECVGYREFEELKMKQNLDITDLVELTNYIALEITKFKQNKLAQIAKKVVD